LCNITSEKKNSNQLEKKVESVKKEQKEVIAEKKTEAPKVKKEEEVLEKEFTKVVEEKKPEKKIVKPPVSNIPKSVSSFSIKKTLGQTVKANIVEEPNENEEKPETTTEQNNSFSEKELIEKWHKFSDKMGDKPRIFNTLTSKDPKLEGENIVSFIIDNKLQEGKINEIQNQLMGYLKSELKNSSIDLKLIITELKEENNKLYTTEDKFKHMLSKNENLGKLKQEFNLDLE